MTQPSNHRRNWRVEFLSVGTVLAIIALLVSLIDRKNRDLDDLQDQQDKCASALITLSSELSKRAALVSQIARSNDATDRQRAIDSDIALAGAWNTELVACEYSDLILPTTDIGRARVTAQRASQLSIANPDSTANANDVTSAVFWASFALDEVMNVELRGIWVFESGWASNPATYEFGQSR